MQPVKVKGQVEGAWKVACDIAMTYYLLYKTGSCDIKRALVKSTINKEGIMAIGIAFGGLVAVFCGLAAMILWTPYDKSR